MQASLSDEAVTYIFRDTDVCVNDLVGQTIRIEYKGEIECGNCGKLTRKSYSGGYCFVCSQKLAACDLCVMDPVRCHYDQGTCREPEWGDKFCNQPHYVYLAHASQTKVGITRQSQIPTRWIDQGAIAGMLLCEVPRRKHAGIVENFLREQWTDRTDWRKLITGQDTAVPDLHDLRSQVMLDDDLLDLLDDEDIETVWSDDDVVSLRYPVESYLPKATTLNLEKTPIVEGQLLGIRGQYLLLDTGAINIRKYEGYRCLIQ